MLVIAGETIVDMIEIAPESHQYQAFTGGGPYNVAKGAAKMGTPAGYISPLSADGFGGEFAREMDALNIIELAPRSDCPSGLAIVRKDKNGHPSYHFYREGAANRDVSIEKIKAAMPQDAKVFYIGGLALADGDDAKIWARLLEEVACPVFVDPNIRPSFIRERDEYMARLAQIYDRANIIKLSDEDIEWLAEDIDPAAYIQNVMDKHNIALGFLTMGSKGAWAICEDRRVFANAPKIKVIDTVGAGDCFSAAVLSQIIGLENINNLGEDELGKLLSYAVTAAAINCMRAGANAPTDAEIRAFCS